MKDLALLRQLPIEQSFDFYALPFGFGRSSTYLLSSAECVPFLVRFHPCTPAHLVGGGFRV
jgi:hypothetical protein